MYLSALLKAANERAAKMSPDKNSRVDSYCSRLEKEIGDCSIIDRGILYRLEKNATSAKIEMFYAGSSIAAFPRAYPLCAIEASVIDKDAIIKDICGEYAPKAKDLSEFERKINPILEQMLYQNDPVCRRMQPKQMDMEKIISEQPKPRFKGEVRNGSEAVFATLYPHNSIMIYKNMVHKVVMRCFDKPTGMLCLKLVDEDASGKLLGENFYEIGNKSENLKDFLSNYAQALAKNERWVFFRDETNRQRLSNDVAAFAENPVSVIAAQKNYNAHDDFVFEKDKDSCRIYKKLEPWAWDLRRIKNPDMPNYIIFPECKTTVTLTVSGNSIHGKISADSILHPFVNGNSFCLGANVIPMIPANKPAEAAKIVYKEYLELGRDLLLGEINVTKKATPAIYNHLSALVKKLETSNELPSVPVTILTENDKHLL